MHTEGNKIQHLEMSHIKKFFFLFAHDWGFYLDCASRCVQTGRTWLGCPPRWTCWATPRWLLARTFGSLYAGAWQCLWGGRKTSAASSVCPADPPPVTSRGSDEEGERWDGLTESGPWWNRCRTHLYSARWTEFVLHECKTWTQHLKQVCKLLQIRIQSLTTTM